MPSVKTRGKRRHVDGWRWSHIEPRLDRLPRTQRQVLQVASLIGAPFEATRLARLAVDAAVLSDLVTGWLDRVDSRYVVHDAAVMNVLYRLIVAGLASFGTSLDFHGGSFG